jgi:predicted Zn-dependent peptidase
MKENFKKKVLKNGLTILYEKRDLPVVSVAFAVRSGGINESLEEKGISHFIEHMLYKGTPSRNAKQIAEQIEKNGGELNGFTSEEITGYWCKMPSEKLSFGLEVLGDMIKNPLFDEGEMEKERKVIFEEIKMRKDNPQIHVFDKIHSFLYTGTLGQDLIGTEKTMNSITREMILEKFSKVYRPHNMILGVVGNADFNEVVRFAESNFYGKEGEIPERKFGLKNEIKLEQRSGIDQANLVFAYHVPFSSQRGSFVARVLSAITAEGMSSRLFSEIREKKNLAYSIKGGSDINKRFAYNFIYAGAMKENITKIRKLILEEFKKVSKELDEKELSEIKQQILGHYKISMEDSQNQLIELIASEVHGKAEDFYEFEEGIKKVNIGEVKKMAAKVKEGNYSFFALVPKD